MQGVNHAPENHVQEVCMNGLTVYLRGIIGWELHQGLLKDTLVR